MHVLLWHHQHRNVNALMKLRSQILHTIAIECWWEHECRNAQASHLGFSAFSPGIQQALMLESLYQSHSKSMNTLSFIEYYSVLNEEFSNGKAIGRGKWSSQAV